MPRLFRLAALAFLAFAISACDSTDTDVPALASLVLVGNQGNFTDENGSVTLYDVNEGAPLQNAVAIGDALVQQIVVDGGVAYVLLNFADSFSAGSGRVDVVDLDTRAVTASINTNSPRSMAVVGTAAYVTNLYGNTVTPIDLASNTSGTPIEVGANPESVVAVGNRVYVANYGFGFDTRVSVVDAAANEVAETIDVGCDGPRSLAVDAEGEVWVFCTGKTVFNDDFTEIIEQTNGAVVVLEGATGEVVTRIDLDRQLGAASLGQDVTYSPGEREAYAVVGQALARFDTATNTQTGTLSPTLADGTSIAAVHYNDETDRLYLGTFTAFDVAGEVLLLNRAGDVVERFTAGIAPAAITQR